MQCSIGIALLLTLGASAHCGQQFGNVCSVTGSVLDDRGAPIAGVFLNAYSETIENGRKFLELNGTATTGTSGEYCMRSLKQSASVFVVSNQWFDFQAGPNGRSFRSTWYPGTSDFGSATSVPLFRNARADFRLVASPTFTVDGVMTGLPNSNLIKRFDSWSETSEGTLLNNGLIETNLEHSTFKISKAAAGDWTYVFRAVSEGKLLEARLHYSLDRDIGHAVLAFSPLAHIPVAVNSKPYVVAPADQSSASAPNNDFFLFLYKPSETRNAHYGLEELEPGAYKLIVPHPVGSPPFQCIESFSPGDVAVVDNQLIVGSQEYNKPISIETGEHCAQLTIRLAHEPVVRASILLVPESLPFAPSTLPLVAGEGGFVRSGVYYPWPLSPGTYRVYEFSSLEEVEYENPSALEHFSGKSVSLEPNKRTEVALETVNRVP